MLLRRRADSGDLVLDDDQQQRPPPGHAQTRLPPDPPVGSRLRVTISISLTLTLTIIKLNTSIFPSFSLLSRGWSVFDLVLLTRPHIFDSDFYLNFVNVQRIFYTNCPNEIFLNLQMSQFKRFIAFSISLIWFIQ